MEYSGESALDLVRDGDLEIRVSCGFLMFSSLKTFVEIRDEIEELLKNRKGERLIMGTASSSKLFIIKEDDYELLQKAKEKNKHANR